jgi:acetylornithine deacetylase/succinyl-diaminopimelate desuccinylase-like protein
MVYGFVPLLKKDNINLSHGIDERVSIESLEFSISLMWDIIRELAKRNGC